MSTAPSRACSIGDMGLDKNGEPGPNFTPGVEIHAGTHGARRRLPRLDLASS